MKAVPLQSAPKWKHLETLSNYFRSSLVPLPLIPSPSFSLLVLFSLLFPFSLAIKIRNCFSTLVFIGLCYLSKHLLVIWATDLMYVMRGVIMLLYTLQDKIYPRLMFWEKKCNNWVWSCWLIHFYPYSIVSTSFWFPKIPSSCQSCILSNETSNF